MTKLTGHLRNHAVAYVGFVIVALGVSYAAISPSITGAQITNHAAELAKIEPQAVNGDVRAWAIVGPAGRVIASGGKPKVTQLTGDPGGYAIKWRVKVGRCATIATIDLRLSRPTETVAIPGNPAATFTAGYAVGSTSGVGNGTVIQTFNQQGQPTPLGFDLVLIC
ncbi:MAG TPA: hypothetical protein VMA77_26020 [Solirubrobacteraceae bacterium]|nr:hypothetical protein [Solirubrobacteraceae bacterium]